MSTYTILAALVLLAGVLGVAGASDPNETMRQIWSKADTKTFKWLPGKGI